MHISTPTLRRGSKTERAAEKQEKKRKISDASIVSTERKLVKKRLVEAQKKSKHGKKIRKEDVDGDPLAEGEEAPLHQEHRDDMPAQDRSVGTNTNRPIEPWVSRTDGTPTTRRSSRIMESVHKASETWDKCRPYIERINGTIMPLHPQGTKAYYQKDGVKI